MCIYNFAFITGQGFYGQADHPCLQVHHIANKLHQGVILETILMPILPLFYFNFEGGACIFYKPSKVQS